MLYNFYSRNGVLRYNDSTSGIFDATTFNASRLSDEIKVVIKYDGYEYEKPEVQQNPLIKKIIDFVDNFDTTLTINNTDDDSLSFGTREHGNVGSETPGKKDIQDAKRLKSALAKQFNNIDIEIETVDEWTHLNVNL